MTKSNLKRYFFSIWVPLQSKFWLRQRSI